MTKTAKSIIWLAVLIIVVLAVIFVGRSQKDSSGPIKVGFMGGLTGDVASLGVGAQAAVQIATDEINAAGGINGRQIQVIYEDSKCTPGGGVDAAQKLVTIDKVVAIIGGLCSGETIPAVKISSAAMIPMISYGSSAPSLSQSGKYFFRTYPSDSYQGKFAAEYAFNVLKARKVAVLYHITDWGTGVKTTFEDNFKALGGTITDEEATTQDVHDYRTQLTKMKDSQPDYFYMPLYPAGGLIAIKQAQDIGIKTKILGADAWGDTKFVAEADPRSDILYVAVQNSPTAEFKAKLLAKIGGDQVPTAAPQADEAMEVLAAAMKTAGTDGDALQVALRKTDYDGVSGKIQFDQNGDITSTNYTVNRIANGQTTIVR